MSYRKLQRTKSQRRALLRDLTTALLLNGSIQTTEARAKEVRKQAEKMITLGKRGDLASRRQAAAFIRNVIDEKQAEQSAAQNDGNIKLQSALQTLFNDVAPRFKSRNGGYTRSFKTIQRRGDAAQMVVIELVEK